MPRADCQRKWREKVRSRGVRQVAAYLEERELALLDAVAFAVISTYPELGADNVTPSRIPSRTAALRILIQAVLRDIPAPQRDEAALPMQWVRLASWAAWRRDRGEATPAIERPETAHEAARAARANAQLICAARQVFQRIGIESLKEPGLNRGALTIRCGGRCPLSILGADETGDILLPTVLVRDVASGHRPWIFRASFSHP